jgi:transcriptional regulator with XRE-family HTH domain
MAASQNIVGTKIRAIRREKGLTQAMLAARCGMLGWDIGENTITKIETNVRCVVDAEILCLASALDVLPMNLLPEPDKLKAVMKAYFGSSPSQLDR